MNQAKIGKFIAECRRHKNLTQAQLAERLSITDRAVSKWETGRGMPDSSIMLGLCKELGISVNELLNGEVINMEDYNRKAEENLLQMKKQQEAANKRLLMMEIVIGLISTVAFITIMLVVCFVKMDLFPKAVLIITAVAVFAAGLFFAMKIEREVGYYECDKCGHKYIPNSLPFWFAMHLGRTRYMKCPECQKHGWHKKVILDDER